MCLGRREEWGMGTHVFKSCISCRNWDSRPFQFSLRFTFSRASSLILLTSFSITLQSLKCWALSSWHLFNMTTAFLKTWHYKKEKKNAKNQRSIIAQRGIRGEGLGKDGKHTSWTSLGANQFWTGDNNTSNCSSSISHHPRISWFKKSICFALSGSGLSTWSFLIWSETKCFRHNGQFGGRNVLRQLNFWEAVSFCKESMNKGDEPRKWTT